MLCFAVWVCPCAHDQKDPKSGFCAMRALGAHIKLALKSPRKSINPKLIVHKLKSIWAE